MPPWKVLESCITSHKIQLTPLDYLTSHLFDTRFEIHTLQHHTGRIVLTAGLL